MILLPVIERELRVEARHSFTYWLRLLGAGAMLLVALLFAFDRGFAAGTGAQLFAWLHMTLFGAIWFLVPLFTADCISRERREGTLGLLFLTPLKAWDIVVAKALAHGLRAMTLCVAVFPLLTIPFLMGGVSWKEAFLSGLVNVSAFCWALAAGLWASSRTRVWLRSLLLAMIGACVGLLVFVTVNFFSMIVAVGPYVPGFTWGRMWGDLWRNNDIYQIMAGAFAVALNWEGAWGDTITTPLPKAGQLAWLCAACGVTLFSLLALLCISRLAARNVGRHWQDEPISARRLWWRQTFCTPVLLLSFFRRWMRRKLNRNPIGWLEQRTWSGRLVTWGWLATMVSFYFAVLVLSTTPFIREELYALQQFLGWLLILSMAVSAAGSFRRERENGVLELLLVAPLTVSQIIGGRLRGLWAQFLPAFVLLAGVSLYMGQSMRSPFDDEPDHMTLLWFQTGTVFTLPVIGLYFSLRRPNFISALLWTLLVGIFLPVALPRLLFVLQHWVLLVNPRPWLPRAIFRAGDTVPFIVFFQGAFAIVAASRLYRNLLQRSFAFQKAVA